MPELDLSALRRIAMAATPGEWCTLPEEPGVPYIRVRGTMFGQRYKIANVHGVTYKGALPCEEEETRANAAHIAAFNPAVVLTLLDRLERAERIEAAARALLAQLDHIGMTREEEPLMAALRAALEPQT